MKIPQDIMVFVTKFLSLGDTPSFTPFKIPGRGGLKNLKPDAQKTPNPQSCALSQREEVLQLHALQCRFPCPALSFLKILVKGCSRSFMPCMEEKARCAPGPMGAFSGSVQHSTA